LPLKRTDPEFISVGITAGLNYLNVRVAAHDRHAGVIVIHPFDYNVV
jgi:hypothetical protein